ncbi:MAG: dTDP-glucose 4,6-dehydratase [Planctomycetes bacterium]|nr:dTDP-glucose 4,6-dehydratase [Planctomycetota bacterium]
MKTILVTGGAGFIGSNYIRLVLQQHSDVQVLNLDALTYAGNLENLSAVERAPRYTFLKADICDAAALDAITASVDEIVHFAAESHVDRSIEDAATFLRTNVLGTQTLLDFARRRGVARFVHVSTDEVYGSLGPTDPAFSETTPLAPNSPYAASKAGSDLLARAAFHTHSMPVLITRCSNNYGPYQFPEKLIPLMIANAMEGKQLPVYGDGMNVRDWIHVEDHCRAVDLVRRDGRVGEVYNVGGRSERRNIDVVRTILRALGHGEELIRYVKDRLGHDRRYAINDEKIRAELGYATLHNFEDGLAATVAWYQQQRPWWERVRSGDYRGYYERMYGSRLAQP